jgi:hypothetical protein
MLGTKVGCLFNPGRASAMDIIFIAFPDKPWICLENPQGCPSSHRFAMHPAPPNINFV